MAKSGPPNISYPGLVVVSLSDVAETSSARGCVTSFLIYYEWKQKNVLLRSSSFLLQPGTLMAKAIVTSLTKPNRHRAWHTVRATSVWFLQEQRYLWLCL